MQQALFTVTLPLPTQYKALIDRVVEVFVVIATIHVLVHVSPSPSAGNMLFGPNFWQMVLFASIGFAAYYLVINKLVSFECINPNASSSSTFKNIRTWIKEFL